jgi:hypothetical protein
VLTAEIHATHDAREDQALRDALRKIRNRLLVNTTVSNPTSPEEELTKDKDEMKVKALVDQIAKSLETLTILDKANCRRSQALKAWKEVLKTDYFDSEIEKAEEQEKGQDSAAIAAAS